MSFHHLSGAPTLRSLRSLPGLLALSLLLACGGTGTDDDGETAGKGSAGKSSGKSGSAGTGGSAGGGGGSAGTAGSAGSGNTSGKGGSGGTAGGGSGGSAGSAGSGPTCPGTQQVCGGQCVDLTTDEASCGACGKSCALTGSVTACENSQCVFKGCAPGFGDCNGQSEDGCEADLKGASACACTPGQTQACYGGPAGTEGKGACVGGTQTCTLAGTGYGPCVGEKLPSKDYCYDELDQDCDGLAFKCIFENEVCGSGGECVDPCDPGLLGTSYIGCVYYPTITPNLVYSSFAFAVAVSNTNDSPVTVTITRGASTVSQTTVAAASVAIVNLPWIPELKGPDPGFGGAIQPMAGSVRLDAGAYKLVATRPVTVYQYSPLAYTDGGAFSYSNDASLLLPVNTWRNSYMVVARSNFYTSSGFYTVVAAQDNTTVTLAKGVRPLELKGGVAGVDTSGNGTVTLNEGDVVTLVTGGDPSGPDGTDPTGTLVTSDRPVQVFGGHQCVFIPSSVAACDHIEESIFPVETLASEYLIVAPSLPGSNVPKANIVRLVATDADTTFTYDPPQPGAPTGVAQAGDWVEFTTAASFQIKGSKRFLLAQYALGQEAGGNAGDPDITLVVPTAQYRTDYLFHAPVSYAQNFVNITAPTTASVVLDGAPVTGFAPIGATGFGFVRVSLPSGNGGNHVITGDQGFGISVYGYGQYTSYWYPGGLDLREIKE